jgi:predicted DNA-binding protein
MATKLLAVRLPEELFDEIDALARDRKVERTAIVKEIIAAGLGKVSKVDKRVVIIQEMLLKLDAQKEEAA